MTKRRAPDTLEAAVARVIGALGHEGAARVVERGVSSLYAWADPDRREGVGVREAVRLDRACRAAGEGTPIADWYAAQLGEPPAAENVDRAFRGVMAELGDLTRRFDEAAADGTIDAEERDLLRREIADIRAAVDRLDGALRAAGSRA
jgi:hypothetical protein